MSALIKYRRGHLVRITPDESTRVSVPKDRLWLIVQNDEVKSYNGQILCCYLTSAENENDRQKSRQDTDALLKAGAKLGQSKTLSKNSLIRCHELHLIAVDAIAEYVGTLSEAAMQGVDEKLRKLLSLPAKLDAYDSLRLSLRKKS